MQAAIHHASARLQEKVFAIAANLLRFAPADLELRDGVVGVVGAPSARMPEPICLRLSAHRMLLRSLDMKGVANAARRTGLPRWVDGDGPVLARECQLSPSEPPIHRLSRSSLRWHERKFLARRAPRHGSQTFLNTRLNRNSSLTAARVVAVLIQLR